MAKRAHHTLARCAAKSQRGQVLVETVIVLPIMIFIILGGIQLVLIQHGRIMTEYAAYNAARAGIVHNANWNVMRNAAMMSTLPIYRKRTDTLARFLTTWARVRAASEITEQVDTGFATLENLGTELLGVDLSGIAPDVSLVEIQVLEPSEDLFTNEGSAHNQWASARSAEATQIDDDAPLVYPNNEIDFDDLPMMEQHPQLGRLTVRVRVLQPLRIPFINKIMFELWLAYRLLGARNFTSDAQDWARFEAKMEDGQYVKDAVKAAPDEQNVGSLLGEDQWRAETRVLRWAADNKGVYMLPIFATYTMQMQSNIFKRYQREPVWFSVGGP